MAPSSKPADNRPPFWCRTGHGAPLRLRHLRLMLRSTGRYHDRTDRWRRKRFGPPITSELLFRYRLDLYHVVLIPAKHIDRIGRLAAVEADVAQPGIRTTSPEYDDGTQRRPAELHEIVVIAERLR